MCINKMVVEINEKIARTAFPCACKPKPKFKMRKACSYYYAKCNHGRLMLAQCSKKSTPSRAPCNCTPTLLKDRILGETTFKRYKCPHYYYSIKHTVPQKLKRGKRKMTSIKKKKKISSTKKKKKTTSIKKKRKVGSHKSLSKRQTFCLSCKQPTNNQSPTSIKFTKYNKRPYQLSTCGRCGNKKSTFS